MVRRLFSRGGEPHRAEPPAIQAWANPGQVDIAVHNNDSAVATDPHLVLLIASGETSEYERRELDIDAIEPGGDAVASVETTRQKVYRIWWFLTWEAGGTAQRASGSVNVN